MTAKQQRSEAAQILGRRGGKAGTDAQNEARKVNGQLGGRPGRVCSVCLEPVSGGHKDRRLDETCGAHGWQWQKDLSADELRRVIADHQRVIVRLERQLARLQ